MSSHRQSHHRSRGRFWSVVAAALLTATVLVPATAASATNLLTNGDFEAGNLSGWSCTLGTVVTSPVHAGTHALQGAASASDDAQCTQNVSVVSGLAVHVVGLGPGQLRLPRRHRRRVDLDAGRGRLDAADHHVHRIVRSSVRSTCTAGTPRGRTSPTT